MDRAVYLSRIGYRGALEPGAGVLAELQLAHLLSVPFENLDIGLGRPIRLELGDLWQKIVLQRRGGFCYELNGLFAWLLEQLGFQATYLNAVDYHPENDSFGMPFDHLALMVRIPGETRRWLADVGYGDTFVRPLDIDDSQEQTQRGRGYRLEPFRGGYQLWQRGHDGRLERQYFFDLAPHEFPGDYEAACRYHQTSPDSIFTQKQIISRLTPEGRVSLESDALILTREAERERRPLRDSGEYGDLLQEYFGFRL